jgi:hypothetical protein
MRPIRVGEALYTVGPLACMHCGAPDHTRDAVGLLTLSSTGRTWHEPSTGPSAPMRTGAAGMR